MTSNSKPQYSNQFGASVSVMLAEAQMSQRDLANVTGMSTAYTNQVITGRKAPSEKWIELVASCLALPDNKKRQLLNEANARRKRSKFVLPLYKG